MTLPATRSPSLALLLEGGLGEEEGVCEHDGAVDDGDGAHGQASVPLRPSHERVVVPARGRVWSTLGLVGRISSCSFLTDLPGSASVLLNNICKAFYQVTKYLIVHPFS